MDSMTDRDDVARVLLALRGKTPSRQPEVGSSLSEIITTYVDTEKWEIKRQITISTRQNITFILEAGAPILRGGGGIVIRATNKEVPSLQYAIKAQRPSLLRPGSTPRDSERAYAEYIYHSPLASENIARLFNVWMLPVLATSEESTPFTAQIPFLILEWVDGATDLSTYIRGSVTTPSMFANIMRQCFVSLDHLHSNNLIHWDVKSDNLLVNRFNTVKLMDIGNARRIAVEPPSDLVALTTEGNYPPALNKFAQVRGAGDSSNRIQLNLDSTKWDDPWLDMWMLARELVEIIGLGKGQSDQSLFPDAKDSWKTGDSKFLSSVFPRDDTDATFKLAYVRLILRRLLYPRSVDSARYYTLAAEVVADLQKLGPEYGAAQEVAELRAVPQNVVRIPVSGNAPLTGRIKSLISEEPLTRLRRHWQLGTISEVYPGAAHRRFEHSIGVFSTVIRYLKALFADRTSVFWRISIEADDVDALLLAALLHDVGHLAYGHFLEEMVGLFRGFTHEAYAQAILRGVAAAENSADTKRWEASAARDHEALLARIPGRWGLSQAPLAFLHAVADILAEKDLPEPRDIWIKSNPLYSANAELLRETSNLLKRDILHSIIESAIDADKFDYLRRDGLHSGIDYPSGIDGDRFFQSITTLHHVPGRSPLASDRDGRAGLHASIAVTRKGLLPVESILFARYQMFRAVYWHHTARAHTAMLQFCVVEYLSSAQRGVQGALQALIDYFRHATDDAAIAWLGEALSGCNAQNRALLIDACAALSGDRKKAYKECFVLRYRTHGSMHKPSEVDAIHSGLMNTFIEINKKEGRAYLDATRALRKEFTEALTIRLGVPGMISDGEVLLDIPPAGRDQVRNIFVLDDGEANYIQGLSPMADAVSATFTTWARHFRVFCAPGLLERGIDREAIANACWEILRDKYIGQASMPI